MPAIKQILKKIKRSSFLFSRFSIWIILLVYISISHIALPMAGKGNFLFFFTWDLFSFMPSNKRTVDITWDNGKTFLFRDHRKTAKRAGIQLHRLYSLRRKQNTKAINHFFRARLIDLCQCQTVYLVKLKGTLAQHYIFKQQLKIKLMPESFSQKSDRVCPFFPVLAFDHRQTRSISATACDARSPRAYLAF